MGDMVVHCIYIDSSLSLMSLSKSGQIGTTKKILHSVTLKASHIISSTFAHKRKKLNLFGGYRKFVLSYKLVFFNISVYK
jgi:hypothetical protein